MKKLFWMGIAILGLAQLGTAGIIVDLGTFDVSAGATFLAQSSQDNCGFVTHSAQCTGASFFAPTVVDLSTLGSGVGAGDSLLMTVHGTECYLGSTCSSPPNIGALFSATSTWLPSSSNPVPDGISAPGQNFVTTSMWFGGDNTNTHDFKISGSTPPWVDVPVGAKFLFIGIFDSFYADNTGNVSITLSIDPPGDSLLPAVPEPGTYLLALGGFAALGLRKLASKS